MGEYLPIGHGVCLGGVPILVILEGRGLTPSSHMLLPGLHPDTRRDTRLSVQSLPPLSLPKNGKSRVTFAGDVGQQLHQPPVVKGLFLLPLDTGGENKTE